jgi:hypothetical protein
LFKLGYKAKSPWASWLLAPWAFGIWDLGFGFVPGLLEWGMGALYARDLCPKPKIVSGCRSKEPAPLCTNASSLRHFDFDPATAAAAAAAAVAPSANIVAVVRRRRRRPPRYRSRAPTASLEERDGHHGLRPPPAALRGGTAPPTPASQRLTAAVPRCDDNNAPTYSPSPSPSPPCCW